MAIVTTDDKHYKDMAHTIRTYIRKETRYKSSELVDGITEVYQQGYTDGGRYGYDVGYVDGRTQGITEGKQAAYDAFWDVYQENGERGNYAGAFGGRGWNKDTFKPKYPIVPVGSTVCDYMFYNFNKISSSTADDLLDFSDVDIDFSGSTRFTNTFQDARIKNLYVDASNATAMNSTFNGGNGGYIDNLTLKVSDKCAAFGATFGYMNHTKEIRFTDDSVIAATTGFPQSTKLSKESIESIIGALSESASGKTLTLSKTAVDKAFETSEGAKDGSTSAEWNALGGTNRPRQNWTITLS